jgi:cellulose synthase/poly-beta-1,6-N-acetylglucosamine synthase-like glycosyltransferase
MTTALRVDVVVPTYRRPELLLRCLDAIAAQSHSPARVIVVVRVDDFASKRAVRDKHAGWDRLQLVEVQTRGVVAAMTAGVAASTSAVIAFTDDDASPMPDWLGRILAHFEEPTVGGVGGRDLIPGQHGPVTTSVGRFTRYGKLIGNHHLGTGPPRDFDVLKGVNMAFRAEALALPAPGLLRGDGAEVDFEVLTCEWARRQGWRLVYDPAVLVDHDAAPRHGADQRIRPTRQAIYDAAYNSMLSATVLDSGMSLRRMAYPLFVGSHDRPGFARALVAAGRGERDVLARVRPTIAGRIAAMKARHAMVVRPESLVVTAASLRQRL